MDFKLIAFSQLDEAGLKKLVALHESVLRTLIADLGTPFVARYYEIIHHEPSAVGFCAVSSDGELLGWAVGSPHPDEINASLRLPSSWFIPQIIKLLFTNPSALWQLIVSLSWSSKQLQSEEDAVELTYFGVSSSARGQGIGKALLIAFADASRSAGYRVVTLSAETENEAMLSLTKNLGYRIKSTFREGRYFRHRLELTL
jgi:ribosomal protein S18 acetylase RimI-like enzyme